MLGLVLVLIANFHFTRQTIFVSRAGPNFEFARLMQDGIAKRDLDAICPTRASEASVAYRDDLPQTADEWLWGDSPFNTAWAASKAPRPIRHMWCATASRAFRGRNLKAAASTPRRNSSRSQRATRSSRRNGSSIPISHRFIPGQLDAYMHSRQQRDEIRFGPINFVHVPVGWLGFGGCWPGCGLRFGARARKTRAVSSALSWPRCSAMP